MSRIGSQPMASNRRKSLLVVTWIAALVAVAGTTAMSVPADAQRRSYASGPTSFSGIVVRREIGKEGDVKHVWLNTGQKIHIHKGQGWGIRDGQRISGEGYWATKKRGPEIVPTSFQRGGA